MLDAEHRLLEEVFPRQVLEAVAAAALRGGGAPGGPDLRIALHHEQASGPEG